MANKLRVLCVDDNPDMVTSTVMLLELAGCDVAGCTSGVAALAVAADFRPNVGVLDLTMPGMRGEELAVRLRDQAGSRLMRFVALTGAWDITAQHRTRNAGFDDHLIKPADPNRLVEAVTGQPWPSPDEPLAARSRAVAPSSW